MQYILHKEKCILSFFQNQNTECLFLLVIFFIVKFQPSLTQYRNSESSCQSPTSPLSQTSYSPVQSPGLPPNSTSLEGGTFSEAFYIQQQKTNQIQHQLEQFTMVGI